MKQDVNPYSYYAKHIGFLYELKLCYVTQKLLPTGKPFQIYIHKVDKISNALQVTSIAIGDTVQADSIVDIDNCYFAIEESRIHIAFRKSYIKGTASWKDIHHALYYEQLDTNLI